MTLPSAEQVLNRNHSFGRHDVIALAIISSAAILVLLPLFLQVFPNGADLKHHYRWAFYFCQELREGALYPRWLSGANRGYGSPVMFYYPPLPFYVVAAFEAVTRNLLLSIKLSCVLAMIASGLSMYVFTRDLLTRAAAGTASVIYMAGPYHFFELYRVTALSEFWSFAWIPLILHAVRRIAIGQGWRASACLAVSYGLLLFTHVPVSLIITTLLPFYALALTHDKRRLMQVAIG